ncbi:hypothetical protein FISHEDRAFT_74004 [Fistulina hepatica ATCC 64428]|uniref:Uncharacterized protein n=1 Tax=Fistulina hepatica ATCC 64428 TaxID=1128425 RepID=A0A0D7ADZ9_9AGAR|nr:hypothetical protein FISHEDRAFT_74004 [Fistulina hepatica ATCC 64428]
MSVPRAQDSKTTITPVRPRTATQRQAIASSVLKTYTPSGNMSTSRDVSLTPDGHSTSKAETPHRIQDIGFHRGSATPISSLSNLHVSHSANLDFTPVSPTRRIPDVSGVRGLMSPPMDVFSSFSTMHRKPSNSPSFVPSVSAPLATSEPGSFSALSVSSSVSGNPRSAFDYAHALSAPRPRGIDPYKRLGADEFDSWVGDMTRSLRTALSHESLRVEAQRQSHTSLTPRLDKGKARAVEVSSLQDANQANSYDWTSLRKLGVPRKPSPVFPRAHGRVRGPSPTFASTKDDHTRVSGTSAAAAGRRDTPIEILDNDEAAGHEFGEGARERHPTAPEEYVWDEGAYSDSDGLGVPSEFDLVVQEDNMADGPSGHEDDDGQDEVHTAMAGAPHVRYRHVFGHSLASDSLECHGEKADEQEELSDNSDDAADDLEVSMLVIDAAEDNESEEEVVDHETVDERAVTAAVVDSKVEAIPDEAAAEDVAQCEDASDLSEDGSGASGRDVDGFSSDTGSNGDEDTSVSGDEYASGSSNEGSSLDDEGSQASDISSVDGVDAASSPGATANEPIVLVDTPPPEPLKINAPETSPSPARRYRPPEYTLWPADFSLPSIDRPSYAREASGSTPDGAFSVTCDSQNPTERTIPSLDEGQVIELTAGAALSERGTIVNDASGHGDDVAPMDVEPGTANQMSNDILLTTEEASPSDAGFLDVFPAPVVSALPPDVHHLETIAHSSVGTATELDASGLSVHIGEGVFHDRGTNAGLVDVQPTVHNDVDVSSEDHTGTSPDCHVVASDFDHVKFTHSESDVIKVEARDVFRFGTPDTADTNEHHHQRAGGMASGESDNKVVSGADDLEMSSGLSVDQPINVDSEPEDEEATKALAEQPQAVAAGPPENEDHDPSLGNGVSVKPPTAEPVIMKEDGPRDHSIAADTVADAPGEFVQDAVEQFDESFHVDDVLQRLPDELFLRMLGRGSDNSVPFFGDGLTQVSPVGHDVTEVAIPSDSPSTFEESRTAIPAESKADSASSESSVVASGASVSVQDSGPSTPIDNIRTTPSPKIVSSTLPSSTGAVISTLDLSISSEPYEPVTDARLASTLETHDSEPAMPSIVPIPTPMRTPSPEPALPLLFPPQLASTKSQPVLASPSPDEFKLAVEVPIEQEEPSTPDKRTVAPVIIPADEDRQDVLEAAPVIRNAEVEYVVETAAANDVDESLRDGYGNLSAEVDVFDPDIDGQTVDEATPEAHEPDSWSGITDDDKPHVTSAAEVSWNGISTSLPAVNVDSNDDLPPSDDDYDNDSDDSSGGDILPMPSSPPAIYEEYAEDEADARNSEDSHQDGHTRSSPIIVGGAFSNENVDQLPDERSSYHMRSSPPVMMDDIGTSPGRCSMDREESSVDGRPVPEDEDNITTEGSAPAGTEDLPPAPDSHDVEVRDSPTTRVDAQDTILHRDEARPLEQAPDEVAQILGIPKTTKEGPPFGIFHAETGPSPLATHESFVSNGVSDGPSQPADRQLPAVPELASNLSTEEKPVDVADLPAPSSPLGPIVELDAVADDQVPPNETGVEPVEDSVEGKKVHDGASVTGLQREREPSIADLKCEKAEEPALRIATGQESESSSLRKSASTCQMPVILTMPATVPSTMSSQVLLGDPFPASLSTPTFGSYDTGADSSSDRIFTSLFSDTSSSPRRNGQGPKNDSNNRILKFSSSEPGIGGIPAKPLIADINNGDEPSQSTLTSAAGGLTRRATEPAPKLGKRARSDEQGDLEPSIVKGKGKAPMRSVSPASVSSRTSRVSRSKRQRLNDAPSASSRLATPTVVASSREASTEASAVPHSPQHAVEEDLQAPFIHPHGVAKKQVASSAPHPRVVKTSSIASSQGTISPTSKRAVARPSGSSRVRVTRSNCRYHRISLPREEDGPRVEFIVPGCSLLDHECIEENDIQDHGDATIEDSRRMVADIETLDFSLYLFGVLRKLVGVDLLREQEVFYLPKPEEVPRRVPRNLLSSRPRYQWFEVGAGGKAMDAPRVLVTGHSSHAIHSRSASQAGSNVEDSDNRSQQTPSAPTSATRPHVGTSSKVKKRDALTSPLSQRSGADSDVSSSSDTDDDDESWQSHAESDVSDSSDDDPGPLSKRRRLSGYTSRARLPPKMRMLMTARKEDPAAHSANGSDSVKKSESSESVGHTASASLSVNLGDRKLQADKRDVETVAQTSDSGHSPESATLSPHSDTQGERSDSSPEVAQNKDRESKQTNSDKPPAGGQPESEADKDKIPLGHLRRNGDICPAPLSSSPTVSDGEGDDLAKSTTVELSATLKRKR